MAGTPPHAPGDRLPIRDTRKSAARQACRRAADQECHRYGRGPRGRGAAAIEQIGACSATRTDLLAALHKKLGLQVISDYYSSWGPFMDAQDTTPEQLIKEFAPGLPANWVGMAASSTLV